MLGMFNDIHLWLAMVRVLSTASNDLIVELAMDIEVRTHTPILNIVIHGYMDKIIWIWSLVDGFGDVGEESRDIDDEHGLVCLFVYLFLH